MELSSRKLFPELRGTVLGLASLCLPDLDKDWGLKWSFPPGSWHGFVTFEVLGIPSVLQGSQGSWTVHRGDVPKEN